ncbi:38127_t:CDS:2, partial [Gigaspora margarita]
TVHVACNNRKINKDTPSSRICYDAVLKNNLIIYIGGIGASMNETTHDDQIGSRFGHSAVLRSTFTQVQTDITVLDVSTTPVYMMDKAPQAIT